MRETPCTSIVRTPLQGRPSTPKRASYPCLGSSSSWCPIMPPPFVRAAAYLYEPSSRRLKWSEPYPRPPLSPRRTGDDVSTVSIQGHRSPRRRIPWTNYHEPSLLLSSHNDSVSLDNERSIDRPVILGVKSLSYFDGRWKSGRWVGDYW